MYIVCADHLEPAIDEFIEIFQMPPDLYRLKEVNFTDWTAPPSCVFCQQAPEFLVV